MLDIPKSHDQFAAQIKSWDTHFQTHTRPQLFEPSQCGRIRRHIAQPDSRGGAFRLQLLQKRLSGFTMRTTFADEDLDVWLSLVRAPILVGKSDDVEQANEQHTDDKIGRGSFSDILL